MTDLVINKKIPLAMGYDAPIAVLNDKPESLFNFLNNYLHKLPIHPSMLIEKRL